jgi:hypothetical protein
MGDILSSRPATGPAEWRLANGRSPVGADTGLVVVLAINPSDAFTCSAMLMEWLEWRRADPRRFRLVFTRAPTEAEARRLRAVRLPLAGTLDNGPRHGTPMEVVFRDGRVIFSDSSVTHVRGSVLLTQLQKHSLDQVVLALSASPSRHLNRR